MDLGSLLCELNLTYLCICRRPLGGVVSPILTWVVFGICFILKPGALLCELQLIYLCGCSDMKENVHEYVYRFLELFIVLSIYIRISVQCVVS